jgi:D-alanine-D-alanine ligase
VVVLGGGVSGEHDVSVSSARSIAAALDRDRYLVVELTIRPDGSWAHTGAGPLAEDLADAVRILERADVVIPALHGTHGEDGTLAGLLDLIGVPYVGSGVFAGAVAMDKWTTKLLAESSGVVTAPALLVTDPADPRLAVVDLPVVVKPNRAGSSLGVTYVATAGELRPAVRSALAHDRSALVESAMVGREIDVAVVELADGSLRFGPPLEIVVPHGAIFDLASKYDGEPDFRIPAELDAPTIESLERSAATMFRALDCAGLARVDFFLTANGLVLNEVNTFPGFTSHSQVPRMFAADGLEYPALLDILIDTAMARSRSSARLRRTA